MNTDFFGATAKSVTGGTGNDVFTDNSAAAAQTITYTTGTGNDKVNVANGGLTNIFKVDAGAGDDFVTAGANLNLKSTYAGGDGTDTLSTNAATAVVIDAYVAADKATLNGNISGFEILNISDALNANLDMSAFGNMNNVSLSATSTTTISKITSGFGLELMGATNAVTLALTDSAADVVNIKLSSVGALDFGSVTAAKVETINITTNDTDTTAQVDALTLVAVDATAVTVAGNAGLTLTNTGNAKITSFDASKVTAGAVTFASENAHRNGESLHHWWRR